MDFESNDLPQTWRRWKEEMELYLELAMAGQQETTKVKLVLYLIGSQGREICNTIKVGFHFNRIVTYRSIFFCVETISLLSKPL